MVIGFRRLFNEFQAVEPPPKPPTQGAVGSGRVQSAVSGTKQGWNKVSLHVQRIAEPGSAQVKSATGQMEQAQPAQSKLKSWSATDDLSDWSNYVKE
jgi:hypothetical protein